MTVISHTDHSTDDRRMRILPPFSSAARLILGLVALLIAAVLLVSFYSVTRDAVAQADRHWARAVQLSAACVTDRAAASADGCAGGHSSTLARLTVSHAARN